MVGIKGNLYIYIYISNEKIMLSKRTKIINYEYELKFLKTFLPYDQINYMKKKKTR